MMNKKEILLRKELENDLTLLTRALRTFEYSYENCKKIGLKNEYSDEELEKFESLTSRFARISDILTQKILKSIFLLLREDAKTFIDRINKAEKFEMIDSAEQLKTIRDLRNEIAHEYSIEDISEIFENVLEYSGVLFEMIDSIKKYIDTQQLTRTEP